MINKFLSIVRQIQSQTPCIKSVAHTINFYILPLRRHLCVVVDSLYIYTSTLSRFQCISISIRMPPTHAEQLMDFILIFAVALIYFLILTACIDQFVSKYFDFLSMNLATAIGVNFAK